MASRSTMIDEHLSDLAVIAIHYDENVATDEICWAFLQAHPRRLLALLCLINVIELNYFIVFDVFYSQ